MAATLEHHIGINSSNEPLILGTKVTVKEIMENLATGMDVLELVHHCGLANDLVIDAVVEYVERLPSHSALGQLLDQYRQQRRQKVKQILLRFKQHCVEQYGQRLVQLILFGSQARGGFKPSSDVDLLVVLKAPLNWLLDSQQVTEFVSNTAIETSGLLSCVFMDDDEFERSPKSLLANIRREGLIM